MRTLASIQQIIDIRPIEGADSIEVATILGWDVVVKKSEFSVGDWCVYCEVDSVFPDTPEFEFLRSKKFRIRTIKLRGQISYGICFPLSILIGKMGPSGRVIESIRTVFDGKLLTADLVFSRFDVRLGDDVTDILGVTKYEPPIPASLAGVMKGNFPQFLIKTDETRIQSIPEILETLNGVEMYSTAKLDGSSMTVYLNANEFGVCSRNLDILESSDNTFWKVARALDLENRLREYYMKTGLCLNVALQGELMGPGIQGNKLALTDHDFYCFNAFDIDSRTYLDYDEWVGICEYLDIKTVPILDSNFKAFNSVQEHIDYATMKSVIRPEVWEEGVVFRSKYLHNGKRISYKAINPQFLLKYEDA